MAGGENVIGRGGIVVRMAGLGPMRTEVVDRREGGQ